MHQRKILWRAFRHTSIFAKNVTMEIYYLHWVINVTLRWQTGWRFIIFVSRSIYSITVFAHIAAGYAVATINKRTTYRYEESFFSVFLQSIGFSGRSSPHFALVHPTQCRRLYRDNRHLRENRYNLGIVHCMYKYLYNPHKKIWKRLLALRLLRICTTVKGRVLSFISWNIFFVRINFVHSRCRSTR